MPQTRAERLTRQQGRNAVRALNDRERLPPGQYVACCGRWQPVAQIPYACVGCGTVYFLPSTPEEP